MSSRHVRALRKITGATVSHEHWEAAQLAASHLERTEKKLSLERRRHRIAMAALQDEITASPDSPYAAQAPVRCGIALAKIGEVR